MMTITKTLRTMISSLISLSIKPREPKHKLMLRRMYKMKNSTTTTMTFLKTVMRATAMKTTHHMYNILPN